MGSVQAGSLAVLVTIKIQTTKIIWHRQLSTLFKKKIFPNNIKTLLMPLKMLKQAEAQAQAAYEANPTPESEEALAQHR